MDFIEIVAKTFPVDLAGGVFVNQLEIPTSSGKRDHLTMEIS